ILFVQNLRPRNQPPVMSATEMVNASEMVFLELEYLSSFMKHCDKIGLMIPNDSQEFRLKVCNSQSASTFYKTPSSWPDPRILDLMAMAQHHGVPTRLLDWTTKAFTAAYFAASSALASFDKWEPNQRLAVWALNIEIIGLHDKVVLHRSPGAISRNLAAQGGLFTVHPHSGGRQGRFTIHGFENYLSDLPQSPLMKLTIPIYESARLLGLCASAGFSGADVYPSADGAGRAVIDWMNVDGSVKRWNGDQVRVRT
ncbi:FRG domain-containing protein, partial [Pseudomonas syringae]|uniref:FRG domain-containing protein n=3 Tax=Pseudomonas TaxID=286 RepID=UPI0012B1D382